MAGLSLGNRLLGSTGLSSGSGLSRGSGLYFGGFTPTPALYLPFALTGTLDPRITFSRPSLATLYDSTGKLTYCPNNLALQSQTFNTTWSKQGSGTFTDNDTVAPDGTTTAERWTAGASGTFASYASQAAGSRTDNFIFSIYVKKGNSQYFWIDLWGSTDCGAAFDLDSGTYVGNAGLTTGAAYGITSVGNGWYRVFVKRAFVNETLSFGFGDGTGNNVISTAGKFTYVWGAQVEAVTYQTTPSTYVATTAAAYYGPRFDYDPATLAARGLLIEEARTNLFTYSQDFANAAWTKAASTVTAGSIIGPDGTSSGTRVQATAGSNLFNLFGSGTLTTTNTVVYTQSCFVKYGNAQWLWVRVGNPDASWAAFDLLNGVVGNKLDAANAISSYAITPIGNGWLRVTMTWTANATSAYNMVWTIGTGSTPTGGGVSQTGAEFFYLFGAQYEAGSFATSYIPTAASSVARSGDSVTMTGTNFSSWYNQTQGTFVGNVVGNYSANTSIFMVNSNGSNGVFASGVTGGFALAVQSYPAGNILNVTNPGGSGTFSKMGLAYKSGDSGFSRNGSSVTTSSNSNVMIVGTSLQLGQDYFSVSPSGQTWIASLTYYNTRLPNATLQSLTLPVIADYYFLVDANGDQITDASGNPLYTQPLYL